MDSAIWVKVGRLLSVIEAASGVLNSTYVALKPKRNPEPQPKGGGGCLQCRVSPGVWTHPQCRARVVVNSQVLQAL